MLRSRISRQFAELVFPRQCPFCNVQVVTHKTGETAPWCESCCDELIGNSLDRCQKCGATTHENNPFQESCKLCHGFDFRFRTCIAIGNYRGRLRGLVVDVKRQRNEVVAFQLGRLLGSQLQRYSISKESDLIVPIPTHWTRRFSRGFHASSVIADGIGAETGITRARRLMYCKRQTSKQGTLSTAARFTNVRNSFGVRSGSIIEGKRLVLVDDVMTSGATVSEAARILLRAGAKSVDVAVVERGAKAS